ncbi:Ig-like domain-containing protein [Flavobacterium olei]|uniref:Ig-like domain-containing protein n=1 Tax=Flavobacterium olei TaxID=1886782 RepID=UPI00321963BE
MIKNYFNLNRGLNIKKAICLLFVFFIFIQISHGQCATPVLGCPNTDLSNFGTASNNNAATIEYDNFVSSFHTTVVRTSNGSFQVWGEKIANNGTSNQLTPLTVNVANFPALTTATPLKAGLGSFSSNTVQGILLATDGLYAWATEGSVLDESITSSAAFQKLTIDGNTNGLPAGVSPGDVKMLFATYKTLAITTCSGDVWVISQSLNMRGNGTGATSATKWYRVTTSANGNPFLTDVVACRGSYEGLMALRSDGTVYVWGKNVYLGNNSAVIADQTTAVQMTIPSGITPKMIGSSGNGTSRSYYILATDGNLYGVGENSNRELGDWTVTDRLSWVQPRYTSATGPVMNNIKWFSSQEHDSQYGSVNVINDSKNIYAFGNNNGSLLGTTNNPSDPIMPNGLSPTDDILAVETGGHTSMIVKNCQTKFGYVGHRISGSMGDGNSTSATEKSYTFATANVQICGAESNPAIQPISTGGGPNSKYCVDDPVLLNPTPTGGTLSILSGPGTLSGNTLSFTGVGTVSVQYSVTTACGGTSVTTRNFDAALCPVDLQVTKVVDNTNASVGSNSVFTITAINNGPYKATGVVINDALPSGYTFVSAVPSAGTWTAPDWTIGNLANAASATLTVTATVNPTGSYANTATISGNNPETGTTNNSATATPIIQTNLSVTKSVDKSTPNVGDTVKFTITASNSGPSAATGVVVTDSLPSGYTFVSATPSAGTWLAPDWTVGSLANGVSETLIITATVNATGSYINTATITGVQNDPTPVNNSGSVTPVVNHAPVANDDDRTAFPLTEDGADGSVAILVNDTDSDGNPTAPVNGANQFTIDLDPLTAGIQTTFSDAKGVWTLNTTTGIVTFNPANNYNGTAKITYTLCDALGLCDSADITFLVNAVNDNPVAIDDSYTVSEDSSVALNPLNLDTDVDGDTLTITSINGTTLTGGIQEITVSNGKVNISATGVITFIADANFNSATAIQFPYEISDGKGGTATANQIITVTAVNDNPVAVDDSYTVSEDTSVALNPLNLDTDVDGDTLTIISINGMALTGGVQEITVPNGKVNISATGLITFTPDANFNSATAIQFPYEISDGKGGTATANQIITVTAVNDNPVAVDDSYTVAEDSTVTLNPLNLDADVDGDTLTITSINGTTVTGGVQEITVPNGKVNISATGVITFIADANFNSATAIQFPYEISDGKGGTATANQVITVTAVNDNPVAVDDTYTVAEDSSIPLNPLNADTDVDGDTLTITSINGIALTGGVQEITVPNGKVNISATGVITFTPDANFNSATAIQFPYEISDGKGGTATANQIIIVTAVNDNPVAVDDSYTVSEDSSIPLNPLNADTDVDGDTLTITSINGIALTGGVQEITVPNGKVNISATGVITFIADANFNSATAIQFPYEISDGKGGTATANQIITVTAVNDKPVAVDDSYTVSEDSSVILNPLHSDTDVDGDTLTITSINGIALTGGVQEITVPNGKVNISATGVITFTPDANFNSTTAIQFPYEISDGKGGTSTANQIIAVTAVNDNPVAVDDSYTVAEDSSIPLNPLNADTDVDGDTLTITSINGIALTGGVQEITVPNGKVNISAAGVITFIADANFNSATAIQFPYEISDGKGGTATANQIIAVTAVNDNPVAVDDSYTVSEDSSVTLNPLNSDTDVDGDTLTITSINGTTLTGGVQEITVPNGKVNISATGLITFTPDANFNSATAIQFPYEISDGKAGTATANQVITVTAVNDNPVANADSNNSMSSNAGETPINALSATDIDGTITNYTIITLPAGGILKLNGTIVTAGQVLTPSEAAQLTYEPNGAFTGNDTFTFTATDNLGAVSTSAVITIPVVNNAPVANDQTNSVIPSKAGATVIDALTASDGDGTIVNYIVLTLPANGILALNGIPVVANQVLTPAEAAILTYDPSGAFAGNDTFTFTATDNNGSIDATPAIVTIPVVKSQLNAVKDEAGSVVGINEVVKVINILDNDTLDNNPIVVTDVTIKTVTPDPKGILTLNPDGTADLAPNAPAGTYTLTYEICEKANNSNCSSATVSVTVVAPEITVTATSFCSDNAAYVTYNVAADNFTPKGLVTINWIDSANNIVATQTNMPLNGTVLWPGTILNANNKPTDWPGWVLVKGQWTEGNDGFELTRPAVNMQFSLNPTKSVSVNYPSALSGCSARPQFGIEAGNDNDNSIADGINGSLEVVNVLDNDKLNGVPVNPADVTIKGQNFPTGITLNADGTIDVAPGTPGGNYDLTYQICEKANASNCTTATVHIFVEVPAISLIMKASLNDTNGNGTAEAGETITYTFTVKNTGNTALQNITIADLLPGVVINGGPVNLAVGESDTMTFTGKYVLTQADIIAGLVSNQATVSGFTQKGVSTSDISDSENIDGDTPTVIELKDGCSIKIFNAVSLNGDEKNTRFYIRGIECYPDNTVQIYNRWGVLVFERDHYNNNDIVFKGFSEGRTTVKESNGLPEGTYYYILRYKDNQSKPQQEAGYLYLTR